MAILTKIYLVRHGETDSNRTRVIQGHLDTPLNSTGFTQAVSVANALREVPFDLALTSDLTRAAATATAILKHHPNLVLGMDENLRERVGILFMGELQGQVYGSARLPAGSSTMETAHALSTRAMTWWNETVVHCASSLPLREGPYNILVVSHGGFISTLVKNLIGSGQITSDKMEIVHSLPNVSVSVIEWDGDIWKLVKYGDVSHLSTGPLDHNADTAGI